MHRSLGGHSHPDYHRGPECRSTHWCCCYINNNSKYRKPECAHSCAQGTFATTTTMEILGTSPGGHGRSRLRRNPGQREPAWLFRGHRVHPRRRQAPLRVYAGQWNLRRHGGLIHQHARPPAGIHRQVLLDRQPPTPLDGQHLLQRESQILSGVQRLRHRVVRAERVPGRLRAGESRYIL